MRVLIISDTHGYAEQLQQILQKVGKIDALIHAGDVEGQEDYIRKIAGCPCYMVAGNCDWYTELEREEEFSLAGYRIFLTHGHRYGVGMGTEGLETEGRIRNAQILIYGHTHKPMIKEEDGMYILNPGSLTYPRQRDRKPTYILMTVDDEHGLRFSLEGAGEKKRRR